MNLEKLLTDQGSEPLDDNLNGPSLRAFINATFKKVGTPPIDATTPCDTILERIYSLDDSTLQSKLLDRTVAELKSDTNYKKMSVYGAILITLIVLMIGCDSMFGGHLSPQAIDALKTIASAAFDLIKASTQTQ